MYHPCIPAELPLPDIMPAQRRYTLAYWDEDFYNGAASERVNLNIIRCLVGKKEQSPRVGLTEQY